MKSFFVCGTFLLLLLHPSSAHAQAGGKTAGRVRVALVSSATGPSVNSLLDLAHVKVSMQPGVELLDRQAMAKILREQNLSLSGLVDANTAAAAGKLLSVELFALVEADPITKEALGLIVYDAATGVKLHDAALPTGKLDEQIDAVSSGIRRAADKEAAGLKGLHTVCLLSARNADLPRAQDSLAHTLAFLLERQLLGSPNLAVLERKRLDFVTKEKMLPTASVQNKALFASLVMIDVEVSRAGTGIRATAFLTDNQGKQLGKVQVEEADPKADSLADKLQSALWKYWQADPPAKPADPRRESKRFLQEAKRLHSQKEFLLATQALEAAFALDPAQPQVETTLANYLADQALDLLLPNRKPVLGKKGLLVPNDKLKDAMNLGLRSLEVRRLGLQKLPPKNFSTLQQYTSKFKIAPDRLMLAQLRALDPVCVDDEVSQARKQLQEQYGRVMKEELERWVEVARADTMRPGPSPGFDYFTTAIQDNSSALFVSMEKSEIELFVLPFYRPWLEIYALPGAKLSNYRVSSFCNQNVPIRSEYAEFHEAMVKQPHPLMKLYGRWSRLRLEMENQKVGPGQAQITYQELRQDALKMLRDYQPEPKVAFQDDLRALIYQFLFMALDQWPYPNADQKYQERFALVDFMLDRQELVETIVHTTIHHDFSKNRWHSERWALSERTLKLLDTGNVQLCGNVNFRKFHLLDLQKKILAERPDFAQKRAPAAAPWSEVDHLVKLKTNSTLDQLGVPMIDGDEAFVAGAGREDDKIWLRLVRISLTDKTSKTLGKTLMRPGEMVKNRWIGDYRITASCLSKDHIFVGTRSDGLHAFDRFGGARLISKDFPSQAIEAMSFHDGKLYVALGGGYLLAVNPESGAYETLASSRRRERLTPFDDSDVFRIPYLVADAERHRLIFLLYQKPGHLIYYPSALIAAKDTTNGLWEYDLKAKTFKRHIELYYHAFLWGSPVRAGHVILSKPGHHHTGVMDFDLAANKGKLLWARTPIGPEVAKESAVSLADYTPFANVQLVRGDWMWCAHPLSRGALSERRLELLPALGTNADFGPDAGLALEPIGRDRLLLGNTSGLWLLKFAAPK